MSTEFGDSEFQHISSSQKKTIAPCRERHLMSTRRDLTKLRFAKNDTVIELRPPDSEKMSDADSWSLIRGLTTSSIFNDERVALIMHYRIFYAVINIYDYIFMEE